MTDVTPRERLNRAAELLGISERLAHECGQAQWTDLLTKIIATLAERTTALQRRDAVIRRRALLDQAFVPLPSPPPGVTSIDPASLETQSCPMKSP